MRVVTWCALAVLALAGGSMPWVGGARESAPGVRENSTAANDLPVRVWALGRIEPAGGVLRLHGPAEPVVVVAELHVQEGSQVSEGEVLATLEGRDLAQARVDKAIAHVARARADLRRAERLQARHVLSEAVLEDRLLDLHVAAAELAGARAALERTLLRSPVEGRILEVHAHPGEKVEREGVLELADFRDMRAVAEVYETDAQEVRVGQRARVTSPALPRPMGGSIVLVGTKVGTAGVLDTDPAAKLDARVVKVEIELNDDVLASRLVNLQVDVEIEVGGTGR